MEPLATPPAGAAGATRTGSAARTAYRRFIVPGLTTTMMMLILLGLGTWQVYRLHWKQRILQQISLAEAAPPIPLPAAPSPYVKVFVTGRFRFDQAAWFGADVRDIESGTQLGAYQVVPLERTGAPTVLVERGWAPDKRQTPLDDPAGQVTVTGYVHPGDHPSWFSAADDAPSRRFFTLDPDAIAAAVGVHQPEPFVLVALGPSTPGIYPAPAQHLPQPPNNHLSYAVTWYGLALVLVVIFIVWVRKALQA